MLQKMCLSMDQYINIVIVLLPNIVIGNSPKNQASGGLYLVNIPELAEVIQIVP